MYVRNKGCLQKIEIDEIYYFTKKDGKVIAVLKDSILEIEGSLYYINELLGTHTNFFRCHKSFIVNTKKISNISKYNNKTYNINFIGIKDQAFITQKNLRLFEQKIEIV